MIKLSAKFCFPVSFYSIQILIIFYMNTLCKVDIRLITLPIIKLIQGLHKKKTKIMFLTKQSPASSVVSTRFIDLFHTMPCMTSI